MNIISLPKFIEIAGGKEEVSRILASFSVSKNSDVEQFLHDRIFAYEESHAARSYFAVNDNLAPLGFYSIAIATYQITGRTPEELKEKLRGINNANRKLIPGILIGQLARFDATSKDELSGTELMQDALSRIRKIHNEIGLRFVWLDCEDNNSLKRFYEKFGFSEVNKDRYCQM